MKKEREGRERRLKREGREDRATQRDREREKREISTRYLFIRDT